jgi:hypothetical protein
MTTSKPRTRRISKKSTEKKDLKDSKESKQKYIDELVEKISKLKKVTQSNFVLHPAPLPKKDTAENRLFQIPFSKMAIEYYKGLDGDEYHCVFRALHVLGLRSTELCIEDSKRIFEMYHEDGTSITNKDIATYLSTIYEIDVTAKVHKDNKMPYLDLQDGYATLVSVQTYNKDDVAKHDDEKSMSGTIIIIYKYKGVIYCYDPSSRKNTVSINEILEELNTYRIEEYICFYKDSGVASLNRSKMVAPILY